MENIDGENDDLIIFKNISAIIYHNFINCFHNEYYS